MTDSMGRASRPDRLLVYVCANSTFVIVIASLWSFAVHSQDGYVRTLLLLIAISATGLAMIYRTARRLQDPQLLKLGYIFVFKLAILLLLLGRLWNAVVVTQVQGNWGPISTETLLEGDQARFYFQADDFARSGFRLSELPSLNYTGVLYIYGVVFMLFGHNPFAPALVNAFALLIATLLLSRVAYAIKARRRRFDWTIGLCMIIPEVMLHDVMTSRDALVMSLLSISVLSVSLYVVRRGTRGTAEAALISIPALILLAVVRTTAVLPAAGSIVLLLLLFRARIKRGPLITIAIMSILVVMLGPVLSQFVGGYQLSYARFLSYTAITPDEEFLSGYDWSEQSIGRRLVPRSAAGAAFLAIPRVLAYVAAPLPNVGVNWAAVRKGDWWGWQQLLIILSSLLYIALFPYAGVSFLHSLRTRDTGLAMHVPFWFTIFAVASGTAIIHERYRLMAIPLLWGCIWLGRTARRRDVVSAYLLWIGALFVGTVFIVVYKSWPV